jgi:hypothetical protein
LTVDPYLKVLIKSEAVSKSRMLLLSIPVLKYLCDFETSFRIIKDLVKSYAIPSGGMLSLLFEQKICC